MDGLNLIRGSVYLVSLRGMTTHQHKFLGKKIKVKEENQTKKNKNRNKKTMRYERIKKRVEKKFKRGKVKLERNLKRKIN